jgi:hypothetical protein
MNLSWPGGVFLRVDADNRLVAAFVILLSLSQIPPLRIPSKS